MAHGVADHNWHVTAIYNITAADSVLGTLYEHTALRLVQAGFEEPRQPSGRSSGAVPMPDRNGLLAAEALYKCKVCMVHGGCCCLRYINTGHVCYIQAWHSAAVQPCHRPPTAVGPGLTVGVCRRATSAQPWRCCTGGNRNRTQTGTQQQGGT